MLLQLCCFLLCLLAEAEPAVETPTTSSSSSSLLSLALSRVLLESEMSQCKTLHVHLESSESESTDKATQQLLDLLTEVQRHVISTLQPLSLSHQRSLPYRPYKHAVLLLVSDIQSLRRIYAAQRATSNLSYTLVYMLQPQPTLAMQLFWQLSVLNVALLTSSDDELQLLSYFPFSAMHDCKQIRAQVVNSFDLRLQRWTSHQHFPAKLSNFFGCTLTCATWPDMPYLVLQPDGTFVGIEGELLQFMANNLNFTVGLYWLSQEEVRDTFNESGWIFDEIFGNKAEYALGGFHYKPSNSSEEQPYSQSMYYFMSHIMLITNLPSAYSTYEKLAFPFHPQLWLAIGLVLALSFLLLWLHQRRYQRYSQHPYYQLLVLTIGGQLLPAELPRRMHWRLLFVTWVMGTLVLRSAYQSGMYQMLRQDSQRNPPQTIAEVLAQSYTIQLVDGNADRWLASLPELRTQQLRHLAASELQSFGQLAVSSGSNERLAIITPYEYFGYFRKVHAMSRRLHLVRERIFTQQLSFNVRRHSHMVGVLNDQIMLAHSHGFLEHWTRQYVSAVDERDESIARITAVSYDTLDGLQPEGDAVDTPEQEREQEKQLRVLAFNELAALFWLTLWAHLVAAFVFGLELLIHK
ncbi:uncharacterized protein LOC132795194 [Drosophila nasuta]|uniref:uncharacterized protein LOC132795194 n=1 Tax=Drosophila nasuta TaxID=42062 RepID=UPI00295E2C9F|nr:uncharacterized protein LOC132795194 [Drosophila nasuta]